MLSAKISALINGVYEVGEILGHGTFGVVYKGMHRELLTPVAIKVFSRGDHISKNFLNESKLIFRLNHPHVTRALDIFYTDQCYAIVFEFMNQGDLRAYLEQVGTVSEYQAVMIAAQVTTGLRYIHSQGIIHRDLKPENILISAHEQEISYKLTDFNISSYSKDRKMSPSEHGSPMYMAPEQFYEYFDQRVDVYALGVILYEMLCGTPPFVGAVQEVINAHIHQAPDFSRLQVKAKTLSVLQKMLHKDPQQRYANSEDLLVDLEHILGLMTLPQGPMLQSLLQKRADLYFLKYLDQSLWPGYVTALNIKQFKTRYNTSENLMDSGE